MNVYENEQYVLNIKKYIKRIWEAVKNQNKYSIEKFSFRFQVSY